MFTAIYIAACIDWIIYIFIARIYITCVYTVVLYYNKMYFPTRKMYF